VCTHDISLYARTTTVGLRPSHARYYLNEMQELRKLLKNLQDKSISANRSA